MAVAASSTWQWHRPRVQGRWLPVGARVASLLVCLSKAYEEKVESDPLEDDDAQAVERLRGRVAVEAKNGTYGVVLVSGPRELPWSSVAVPIWRAYCERHRLGFFLQEEPLSTDLRFEWTKPRVLMELLPETRWKYVFFVDASSLPANFNKSWTYAIKQHMRHKRYANDNVMDRLIFCPWDCEEEYENAYEEGACYGPIISGCIFWAKKPQTTRLVRTWYAKRHGDFTPDQALVKAFSKMRQRYYEEVFLRDVQKEMGRKGSSFLARFGYDKHYGWNIRDQVHDYIASHKELRAIANRAEAGRRADL